MHTSKKLEIVNSDIPHSKGILLASKIKQYQTVRHSEILTYGQQQQDETLLSVFRTKRDDMNVKKETINEHFKKIH